MQIKNNGMITIRNRKLDPESDDEPLAKSAPKVTIDTQTKIKMSNL